MKWQWHGRCCAALSALLLAGCIALAMIANIGCAQQTETPISQPVGQDVTSPTRTDQDAATQGSQVFVYVINAPGVSGLPKPDPLQINVDEGITSPTATVLPNGSTTASTDAGYTQQGITVNVTTGGSTPSLTGTTTATASPTQAPSVYPTVTPTQDVRPRTGITVPIAVAPGGIIDQAASAGAGEGNSTLDKQSTNELRRAELNALADKLRDLPGLLELLGQVFGTPATATAPAE